MTRNTADGPQIIAGATKKRLKDSSEGDNDLRERGKGSGFVLSNDAVVRGHASSVWTTGTSTVKTTISPSELLAQASRKYTLWIPANLMTARQPPHGTVRIDSGSNDNIYQVFQFDKDTDEGAQFTVGFPKSWNAGTITFKVVWENVTTASGNVVWALHGRCFGDNSDPDGAKGTAIGITDASSTTASQWNISAESAAVTLTDAAKERPAILEIFRDANHVSDTLSEDAWLVGVWVYYTTDAATDA